MLGILLCATTGLIVSPVSWSHHYVWIVPTLAWLALGPDRPRGGRWWALGAAALFWAAPIFWVPDRQQGYGGPLVLLAGKLVFSGCRGLPPPRGRAPVVPPPGGRHPPAAISRASGHPRAAPPRSRQRTRRSAGWASPAGHMSRGRRPWRCRARHARAAPAGSRAPSSAAPRRPPRPARGRSGACGRRECRRRSWPRRRTRAR